MGLGGENQNKKKKTWTLSSNQLARVTCTHFYSWSHASHVISKKCQNVKPMSMLKTSEVFRKVPGHFCKR